MSQSKFIFRVSVEVEYTAAEIKSDFDSFSEMTIEDIEKQLTWLCNEQGIIDVENDGRATEDAQNCVNDFIEANLEVEEAKDSEEKAAVVIFGAEVLICEAEDDSDDWEEVYSIDTPLSLINHFKGSCQYYQTAGGGPEGGYVLFDSYLYSVTRHWFEDWSSKLLVGKKLEYSLADEMKGKVAQVRVV